MDPFPKNNRGAPCPGPVKLEVSTEVQATVYFSVKFPFLIRTPFSTHQEQFFRPDYNSLKLTSFSNIDNLATSKG